MQLRTRSEPWFASEAAVIAPHPFAPVAGGWWGNLDVEPTERDPGGQMCWRPGYSPSGLTKGFDLLRR